MLTDYVYEREFVGTKPVWRYRLEFSKKKPFLYVADHMAPRKKMMWRVYSWNRLRDMLVLWWYWYWSKEVVT